MDIKEENRKYRAAKLRCGICQYVTNGCGRRFLGQVRDNFYSFSDAEFDLAIEEMVKDGDLARTVGPRGGVILQQVIQTKEMSNG